MCKNLCVETTFSTIAATAVYAIVIHIFRQSFELENLVIFAAVYGVVFYFSQRYFRKKVKKRK